MDNEKLIELIEQIEIKMGIEILGNNIPMEQFTHIARRFPIQHQNDLIQDMVLLYLESPKERQTLMYVGTVYHKRCIDFLSKYTKDYDVETLMDDYFGQSDDEMENERYAAMIEDHEGLERKIIMDDLIHNLKLTPEERKIQELFYFDGYTVAEILNLSAEFNLFVQDKKTIYNILTKGQ